jgi:murein DD-endopeptidase MepM/ murein hydrolase activator NlpD
MCLLIPGVAALEISDDWQQGAVIIGQLSIAERTVIEGVEFEGRKLHIAKNGQFVIGLGRDAAPVATLVIISKAKREQRNFVVKAREYKVQRVDGVPQQTVEPSPDQVERSEREAELVSAARKGDLALMFFAQKFQWPLIGPISGVYGSQRIYNGVPKAPHYGVDIARPTGARVRAPAGGLVTLAHPDMFFSGGTLIIDHGHGLSSTFIHLSKILVKKGDSVVQGQDIALVGQTGRASGPHLHWAMNWFKTRVDPQLLVGPMPEH